MIRTQLALDHGAEGSVRLVPLEELFISSRIQCVLWRGNLRSYTRDLVESLEAIAGSYARRLQPLLHRMLHEDLAGAHLSYSFTLLLQLNFGADHVEALVLHGVLHLLVGCRHS